MNRKTCTLIPIFFFNLENYLTLVLYQEVQSHFNKALNTKVFYSCCFCRKLAHDVQKAVNMGLLNINHRQVLISGRNDNPCVQKKATTIQH